MHEQVAHGLGVCQSNSCISGWPPDLWHYSLLHEVRHHVTHPLKIRSDEMDETIGAVLADLTRLKCPVCSVALT